MNQPMNGTYTSSGYVHPTTDIGPNGARSQNRMQSRPSAGNARQAETRAVRAPAQITVDPNSLPPPSYDSVCN